LDKYQEVAYLAEGPDSGLKRAWEICDEQLIKDPKDPRALINACFVANRLGALGAAYHLGRSATQLYPREINGWINFGYACSQLWRPEEATEYYKRAMDLAVSAHDVKSQMYVMLNLAALFADLGWHEKCEAISRRMLEIEPENNKALCNLAICRLAQGDWSAWVNYRRLIGTPTRVRTVYKDEPEWDGSVDKTVVLYA